METELDHMEDMDHGGSHLDNPVDDSLSGDEMFMTTMDEPVSSDASDGSLDGQDFATTMDDHSGMEHMSTLGQTEPISQISDAQLAGIMAFIGLWLAVGSAILVVMLVAFWRIFTKAGQAGWKSLIPVYSSFILLQIIGRPGWWLLLFFVPFVNLVIAIITSIDTAKSFGRSDTFGIVGLFLFSLIGYCILAFGSDKYVGPAALQSPGSTSEPPVDNAAPAA